MFSSDDEAIKPTTRLQRSRINLTPSSSRPGTSRETTNVGPTPRTRAREAELRAQVSDALRAEPEDQQRAFLLNNHVASIVDLAREHEIELEALARPLPFPLRLGANNGQGFRSLEDNRTHPDPSGSREATGSDEDNDEVDNEGGNDEVDNEGGNDEVDNEGGNDNVPHEEAPADTMEVDESESDDDSIYTDMHQDLQILSNLPARDLRSGTTLPSPQPNGSTMDAAEEQLQLEQRAAASHALPVIRSLAQPSVRIQPSVVAAEKLYTDWQVADHLQRHINPRNGLTASFNKGHMSGMIITMFDHLVAELSIIEASRGRTVSRVKIVTVINLVFEHFLSSNAINRVSRVIMMYTSTAQGPKMKALGLASQAIENHKHVPALEELFRRFHAVAETITEGRKTGRPSTRSKERIAGEKVEMDRAKNWQSFLDTMKALELVKAYNAALRDAAGYDSTLLDHISNALGEDIARLGGNQVKAKVTSYAAAMVGVTEAEFREEATRGEAIWPFLRTECFGAGGVLLLGKGALGQFAGVGRVYTEAAAAFISEHLGSELLTGFSNALTVGIYDPIHRGQPLSADGLNGGNTGNCWNRLITPFGDAGSAPEASDRGRFQSFLDQENHLNEDSPMIDAPPTAQQEAMNATDAAMAAAIGGGTGNANDNTDGVVRVRSPEPNLFADDESTDDEDDGNEDGDEDGEEDF